MMSTDLNIDFELFCQVCGKSWSYQDANPVQVEHLSNLFGNNHNHSLDELRAYNDHMVAEVNYADDTDE